MTVEHLPVAPRVSDQANFDAEMYALITALTTYATEVNATVSPVASSASNASTQAGNALTHADTATTKANDAAGYALDAKGWAQSAHDSADETEASKLLGAAMMAKYLSTRTSDPAYRPDSSLVQRGDWYLNTATGVIRMYDGTAWRNCVSEVSGVQTLDGQTGALTGYLHDSTGIVLQPGDIKESLLPLASPEFLPCGGDAYLRASYPLLSAVDMSYSEISSGASASVSEIATDGAGTWLLAHGSSMRRSTDDGKTWSIVGAGFSGYEITRIVYGDGVWMAVGANNRMRRSTDGGITWSAITSGFGSGAYILNIATDGAGTWMAISGNQIRRSTDDGVTWSGVTAGFSSAIYSIAYGDGVWIAVGTQWRRSTDDGVTWSAITDIPDFGTSGYRDLCSDGAGTWVVTDQAYRVARSVNAGVSWAVVTDGVMPRPGFVNFYYGVVFSAGVWLLFGREARTDGVANNRPLSPILRSTDGGASWHRSQYPGSITMVLAAAGSGGTWVVGGNQTTLSRSDPDTFTTPVIPSDGLLKRFIYTGESA